MDTGVIQAHLERCHGELHINCGFAHFESLEANLAQYSPDCAWVRQSDGCYAG